MFHSARQRPACATKFQSAPHSQTGESRDHAMGNQGRHRTRLLHPVLPRKRQGQVPRPRQGRGIPLEVRQMKTATTNFNLLRFLHITRSPRHLLGTNIMKPTCPSSHKHHEPRVTTHPSRKQHAPLPPKSLLVAEEALLIVFPRRGERPRFAGREAVRPARHLKRWDSGGRSLEHIPPSPSEAFSRALVLCALAVAGFRRSAYCKARFMVK
jgi:hypothetical protein